MLPFGANCSLPVQPCVRQQLKLGGLTNGSHRQEPFVGEFPLGAVDLSVGEGFGGQRRQGNALGKVEAHIVHRPTVGGQMRQ